MNTWEWNGISVKGKVAEGTSRLVETIYVIRDYIVENASGKRSLKIQRPEMTAVKGRELEELDHLFLE